MQAEQWNAAHQLLGLHLAPQLFFASHTQEDAYPTEQQQQLQSQLQHLLSRLQPHAAQLTESDDATNPADIHAQHASWDQGVGVYATYYALQVCKLHPSFHTGHSYMEVCRVDTATAVYLYSPSDYVATGH